MRDQEREDLALLHKAVKAGGACAQRFWRSDFKVWQKPSDSSPVSEADFAVNEVLQRILCAERPDYGWLSEEDKPEDRLVRARAKKETIFIVDPIDGTRNFIKGDPIFALSVGIATRGEMRAGVVFLPQCGLLFEAQKDAGARLNDVPLRASTQSEISKAKVIATRETLEAENWRAGQPPPFERHFTGPLSYRLCLVAQGRFDAMVTLRPTWEWDIAAGSLIASEAGARVSDSTNAPLRFNAKEMRVNGLIAGAPEIHSILAQALA